MIHVTPHQSEAIGEIAGVSDYVALYKKNKEMRQEQHDIKDNDRIAGNLIKGLGMGAGGAMVLGLMSGGLGLVLTTAIIVIPAVIAALDGYKQKQARPEKIKTLDHEQEEIIDAICDRIARQYDMAEFAEPDGSIPAQKTTAAREFLSRAKTDIKSVSEAMEFGGFIKKDIAERVQRKIAVNLLPKTPS